MPRRPAAINWCGKTIRSRKRRFCGPKCRNDFIGDAKSRRQASADVLSPEVGLRPHSISLKLAGQVAPSEPGQPFRGIAR
jgi:hypothetical protein